MQVTIGCNGAAKPTCLKWLINSRRPLNRVVSQPNPDRDFRATLRVRLMALRLEDCAISTSFVIVATVHSLGNKWLRNEKRTPNYQSLGLLCCYKLGDDGSPHDYQMPACGSMTNVRQSVRLLDCATSTSLATDSVTCDACFTTWKSTLNVDA
jgi:hypothetical protein